ncbi:4-hydroxy-tetrahydrodipicolinate synthase [Conexibacter sp. JD483]|uniref:4-hydroxy-tetrahydrodipicolinate synthase n=1 Tax=unclassified Conexibacter TaxID=2627773 RepID=UPI0027240ED9|nr:MULTISPECIES: 4-hydroxy-tetrahydrodipicolinate synthase [unclassified Conexibacter]MDO8188787.1 4-hydroxy-tetrahydrodipicolinate synthase [Conexibacter sp. CPCC 205706]MDO8201632.1 4-hydroxy-tetrahydrodipicolinate synthase [Conexibacter sp. CPCC 205762]MDR9373096.1 4-hydroxy-tetrahydrodipicolinate synthase [Conexibacter sp. JD483]
MALIEGLHVPLVTPFDRAGAVDLAALERLAGRVLDGGADGLVALGTTAEAATLTRAEHDAIVDRCAGVCAERGVPLTVGAGGNDTAAAVAEVARRGSQRGVAALLSVVPPYTRPSLAGVRAHFAALAAASPVPLLVYDVPARTGIRLPAADQLALAQELPAIAGVKLAVPALDDDALDLLERAPASYAVLCGEDRLMLPMTAAGGRGAITASAHVATERFAALLAAARAGELDAARAASRALAPLVRALFAEPNPVVIKALLAAEGAIESAAVRLPLTPATAAAVERALDVVAALASAPAL